MNNFKPTLFVCLAIAIAALPVYGQDTKPGKDDKSSKSEGLRKIASGSQHIDIDIDETELESTVETAVENSMRVVEEVLENLEIHIPPIAVNLGEMNIDIDPIDIEIPAMDIDIEPMDIDMSDMDIDIDIDHDDVEWNDNDNDNDNDVYEQEDVDQNLNVDKENDKVKEKSGKEKNKAEKDKAKGLKKLN